MSYLEAESSPFEFRLVSDVRLYVKSIGADDQCVSTI